MMSHIDLWSTLATMVGLTPPPHGAWTDNDGKPIYFDSIDNSAYIMGKAKHSARTSWIYVDGETFAGERADIGDDPENPHCTSPGNTCIPRRTLGSAHRPISAPSARLTTSPWTRSRNTT